MVINYQNLLLIEILEKLDDMMMWVICWKYIIVHLKQENMDIKMYTLF